MTTYYNPTTHQTAKVNSTQADKDGNYPAVNAMPHHQAKQHTPTGVSLAREWGLRQMMNIHCLYAILAIGGLMSTKRWTESKPKRGLSENLIWLING